MTTVPEVITEMRKIATERPDFVYVEQPMNEPERRTSGCSYVSASVGLSEGEGCIVGQALQRLGFDKAALQPFDGHVASAALTGLGVTHGEGDYWIDKVQSKQDTGSSWGEAVRLVDAEWTS